jgi:hypothetical protein
VLKIVWLLLFKTIPINLNIKMKNVKLFLISISPSHPLLLLFPGTFGGFEAIISSSKWKLQWE